jgi:hypothetical protein
VRHAKTFIRQAVSDNLPWFLYFADLHPHTALFNHPRFGPGPPGPYESSNGQYGQVLRELDWAVGELLTTLDTLEIARDTLVIFTSDNGPYLEEGWEQSGRKGGLKGGKGQTWEGGIRVPAIVRWPGTIPAGAVSSAPVRALDLMPTIAAFAGVRLPEALLLDGVDQSHFFQRPTDALNGWLSSRKTSFHYCGVRAIGARYLEYKVHWATQRWDAGHEHVCTQCCPRAGYTAGLFASTTLCQCDAKALDERSPPLIFNIRRDPNETHPIRPDSMEHAHVLATVEQVRAGRKEGGREGVREGRRGCRQPAPDGRDAGAARGGCRRRERRALTCARVALAPPPARRCPRRARRSSNTSARSTTTCRASTARCRCRSRRGRAARARCRSARRTARAGFPPRSARRARTSSSTTSCTARASASATAVDRATAAPAGTDARRARRRAAARERPVRAV